MSEANREKLKTLGTCRGALHGSYLLRQFEHIAVLVGDQRIQQGRLLAGTLLIALRFQRVERQPDTVTKQAFEVGQGNATSFGRAAVCIEYVRCSGRHIKHAGISAPFRMQRQRQRQRDFVLVDKRMNKALKIIPIADPTNTTHAMLRAGGRQAFLDTRLTENTLFGLGHLLFEVNLLAGTGRDAVAVPAAAFLIDQHNTVLLAFIDCNTRTGSKTGRVSAVIADTRHVTLIAIGVLPSPSSSSQLAPQVALTLGRN